MFFRLISGTVVSCGVILLLGAAVGGCDNKPSEMVKAPQYQTTCIDGHVYYVFYNTYGLSYSIKLENNGAPVQCTESVSDK